MKKILIMFITLLFALNLFACEDISYESDFFYDENGNHVLASDSGNTIFF